MKLTRNSGLALLLIFFGSLIILNKIGVHTGHLMSWLFPAAMVGLGYLGIKNGRTAIGWILMGLGGIILLGKLSGFFAILIAIGLIVYGISMLRGKSWV